MWRNLLAILVLALVFPVMAQDEVSMTVPSHITPSLEVLPANLDIVYARDYQQVIGAVDIYDAPGGNYLRTRPAGTFFVSVLSYSGGWAQINAGEWILTDALQAAPRSYLGGVFLDGLDTDVQSGLLHESVYLRTVPGTEDYSDVLIEEYNPVYIYESRIVDDLEWVRIGDNAWIRRSSVRYINPVTQPVEIESQRWVGVDREEQILIAYDGDSPVFATLVSTGLEESPTHEGFYSTYARFSPRDMSRGNINQPWFYHMEDVPYTFYFNDDQALHGAYWHNHFGTPQSHGCVNMSLTAAHWVYNFLSETVDITDENAVWSMVWVY